MLKGNIKCINSEKGYGFIKVYGSDDIFFHISCLDGISFDELYEGMEIEVHGTKPGKKGLTAVKVYRSRSNAQKSDTKYKFLNPYNFVRYIESDRKQDGATPEEKLLGKMPPPPHDRMLGLNGEIKCQVITETPLFVSDSHGVKTDGSHSSYRFFEYDGKKAIPASSLRGMVRSVFEAVTNSCFSVFDGDRKLSYHAPVNEARELVPARVEKKREGYRLHLLTGTTGYKPKGPDKKLDKLYAAWIRLYEKTVESKSDKTTKKNPNSSYGKRKPVKLDLKEYGHKTQCYALMEEMTHPKRGFKFWNVLEVSKNKDNLPAPEEGQIIELGWLCITNQNIGNKHDERFFFRTEENQDTGVVENIPSDVIDDYNLLLKEYQERHRDSIKKRENPNQVDWSKGDPEPAYSRFITAEEKLEDGDLVYARLCGSKDDLQVEYIVPVSIPRVRYKKSIGELLPEVFQPCQEIDKLCPACRLFGWVKNVTKPKNNSDIKEVVAYKGRLRFEHAILQSMKGKPFDEMPLAILSSPKPTTERFYLLPSENLEKKRWIWENTRGGYNNGENKLRGRKFYRHHGKAYEENYRATFRTDQNRSVRGVVPELSEFTFSIKFNNLSPLELGALLWVLELDGKGFHRLGYAKPLGFGSIKIKVSKINIIDPLKRYSSIKNSGIVPLTEAIKEEYINKFKQSMCIKFDQKEFDKIKNVRDILVLSQTPANELPVHYPRPDEKPRDDNPSFNWFVGNKKYGLALPVADKNTFGLPLIDKNGNVVD